MSKDPDYIVKIEQAITKKYGEEAIQNPKANWDTEKEKMYLEQMRELYKKQKKNDESNDKVEVNGIKVSKKLLNRDHNRSCPVCRKYSFHTRDDLYMNKFKACFRCYVQYIEGGREERWINGWRPQEEQ